MPSCEPMSSIVLGCKRSTAHALHTITANGKCGSRLTRNINVKSDSAKPT